jgi:predicted HAD superfamily phosphohydrolase
VVYAGDGSSDVHVMLHVNARDGFTIAVSESKHVSQIAQRTVLSTSALGVLAPILERIVGLNRQQIRKFLESHGFLIQEWDKVRAEWLTLRQARPDEPVEEHAHAGVARV